MKHEAVRGGGEGGMMELECETNRKEQRRTQCARNSHPGEGEHFHQQAVPELHSRTHQWDRHHKWWPWPWLRLYTGVLKMEHIEAS